MGKLNAMLHNRIATAGALLFALICVISLAANWLPLVDPNITDPANRLQRPFTDGALLGTDHLGRDLLSRLLHGTRLSVIVGFTAAIVAALIGSAMGIVAGYFQGRIDNWLMRSIDMLMAFPYILIALAIVAALGPGLFNALIAVAIVNIPFFARNIRGVTLSIARSEFIDAARLNGLGSTRIITTELLPNVLPYIVVAISTTVGWMIVETAGLSFLGLGSQPPQADLGSMLGEGRKLLINAPHVSFVPGIMIFLLVISINLCGDGIRDALDPRLKSVASGRPASRTAISTNRLVCDKKTDALMEVSKLHTAFDSVNNYVYAVNGIDLHVERGQCVGLIGESGSGKSVCALSLTALVASPPGKITNGTVHFEQQELLGLNSKALRSIRGNKIAYIFQDPMLSLHPLFTVGQQICEAIQCHQTVSKTSARAQAIALIEQVRIANPEQCFGRFPHQLSGGMRQRIAIAMALANNPDLLIADEPTTALDVTIQAEILSLLNELRIEKQIAMIFITHDIGVVYQICDKVSVMYSGQIVESGLTKDVLTHPAHPYTRALIDCLPEMSSGKTKIPSIPGLPPTLDSPPTICAFSARCRFAKPACSTTQVRLSELHNPNDNALDWHRTVRCLYPIGATLSYDNK